MNKIFYTGLLTALTLSMSGCAYWKRCDLNWYELGLQDGLKGLEASHVDSHRHLCLDTPVEPDYKAYDMGHWDGLNDFCSAENGLAYGRNERAFPIVCEHHESDFALGYEKGQAIIPLDAEAAEIKTEIHALTDKLDEKPAKKHHAKRLQSRIQFLQRELERVESLIRAHEAVHYLSDY